MKSKLTLILVALMGLGSAVLAGDTYNFDVNHSNIGFSVRHMMLATVPGKFTEFTGTIVYDEQDVTKSSINVTIDAASINTNNDRRDNHLRSADFFDVENHPEITFTSKAVKKTADGFVAVGDLTIRGVTKEVNLPFQILGTVIDTRGNKRIGAEATLTINRQDFNVSWSKSLDNGSLVASDEVKISIAVEAIKEKDDDQKKS